MAISQMAKVIIVSHRTEATQLLEALQRDGICQILNAEEAMVSKDFPELSIAGQRPKDIEDILGRLTKAVAFLKNYAQSPKGLAAALSPRTVIDQQVYNQVVSDESILRIVEQCEQTETAIEKLNTESENLRGTLGKLAPWVSLQTPVEEIGRLKTATALAGLIPAQKFEQILEQTGKLGAVIQQIAIAGNNCACLVVCLNENLSEVQKLLRSADFEPVSFESMTGTVAELIEQHRQELSETRKQLQAQHEEAASLSEDLLKLQILCDHYANLLNREQTKGSAPATEATVILEGWVRETDYAGLEKIVSGFGASSLSRIAPAEDEEIPVEIENNNFIRPFEVITRLYGMPLHFEVDPTILLAPFFAVFFGLCLSDAGYGLLMIATAVYFIKKSQVDKKFMYMFLICSIFTVICGALTGSWFGDAIQLLNVSWLNEFRNFFLRFGFDPSIDPMDFFVVSLVLGYIQLMFGITIAFLDKLLRRKDIIAAVCDHLTWLVMLNSLAAYGFAREGMLLTPQQAHIFLKIAAVPAATIFLFSHREGGIVARLGMGFYNLASAMFYIGDTLSYVRLMALGMVTAGFAAAINQMAVMAGGTHKYAGPAIAVVVLIGLHLFNLGISALGAFVHSLRLQYVEFFPKFFTGGGKLFEPLSRQFRYIYVSDKTAE